jgi:glyoxylase-like metal-dependent hydrolase (beta-lactamase superfamily II)
MMKSLTILSTSAAFLSTMAFAGVTQATYGPIKVHTMSEDGAQAHVFELPTKLIIADTGMTEKFARKLKDYATNLKKPIDCVVISHAHPDHFKGSGVFKGQKVVTLAEVKKDIPAGFPIEGSLKEGKTVIDSVNVEFIGLRGGEAPYSLLVAFPDQKLIYAAEFLFNKQHAYIYRNDFDGWIAGLKFLQSRGFETFLAADGTPTLNASVIPENIAYLEAAKVIKNSTKTLNEYKTQIKAKYPTWSGEELIDFAAKSNPDLFK